MIEKRLHFIWLSDKNTPLPGDMAPNIAQHRSPALPT